MTPIPRLYAIADAHFGDPVELSKSLIAGGARLIQIRNKTSASGEFLGQVERVVASGRTEIRVLVNDRSDIALMSGAAGVHLGQSDLPAAAARALLGPDRIIGVSTHNIQQALEADTLAVDYIAVGPIFPTTTKQNPDPVIGLEGLASIAKIVHKPIVAIGGIRIENAREVLSAGAHAVAVIRDLLSSTDIASRTQEWIDVLSSD